MKVKLWGTLPVLCAVVCHLAAQAPTQLPAFPTNAGTYSGSSPTYKDHPDFTCSPSATVDSILCVSGESVDLYTKAGKRISSTPLAQWMTSKLPGVKASKVNNPRVLFDPFIDPTGTAGRHVFVCSCGYINGEPQPYRIVSISDTGDSAGSWHAAQLGTKDYGDLTLVPGFDKNGLYVVHGQSSQDYGNSALAVWKHSSLGKEVPAPLQTFDSSNGAPTYQIFPAPDYNAQKPQTAPMYFIAACAPPDNAGACRNNVRKLTLTLNILTWNSAGTSVKLSKTRIATNDIYNGRPGNAIQPKGFGIRANKSHFSGMSVQGSNGHLHTSKPTSMKARMVRVSRARMDSSRTKLTQ